MHSEFFFKNWTSLFRILLIGTTFYFALLILLRVTGKRTLSRFNAFDFTITMAIGSILGRAVTDEQVSLTEGVVAAALLIFLGYLLSWLSVRHAWVRKALCAEPTLLFYRGTYQRVAMKQERVTEEEIRGAIHERGISEETQVEAVILESNGNLAVLVQTIPINH